MLLPDCHSQPYTPIFHQIYFPFVSHIKMATNFVQEALQSSDETSKEGMRCEHNIIQQHRN